MIVHKLIYESQEQAIADLAIKATQAEAIVHVGKIVDVQGTYDDEGNEITPPTFLQGWHVDVMTKEKIDFDNEVFPNNPKHLFYEID